MKSKAKQKYDPGGKWAEKPKGKEYVYDILPKDFKQGVAYRGHYAAANGSKTCSGTDAEGSLVLRVRLGDTVYPVSLPGDKEDRTEFSIPEFQNIGCRYREVPYEKLSKLDCSSDYINLLRDKTKRRHELELGKIYQDMIVGSEYDLMYKFTDNRGDIRYIYLNKNNHVSVTGTGHTPTVSADRHLELSNDQLPEKVSEAYDQFKMNVVTCKDFEPCAFYQRTEKNGMSFPNEVLFKYDDQIWQMNEISDKYMSGIDGIRSLFHANSIAAKNDGYYKQVSVSSDVIKRFENLRKERYPIDSNDLSRGNFYTSESDPCIRFKLDDTYYAVNKKNGSESHDTNKDVIIPIPSSRFKIISYNELTSFARAKVTCIKLVRKHCVSIKGVVQDVTDQLYVEIVNNQPSNTYKFSLDGEGITAIVLGERNVTACTNPYVGAKKLNFQDGKRYLKVYNEDVFGVINSTYERHLNSFREYNCLPEKFEEDKIYESEFGTHYYVKIAPCGDPTAYYSIKKTIEKGDLFHSTGNVVAGSFFRVAKDVPEHIVERFTDLNYPFGIDQLVEGGFYFSSDSDSEAHYVYGNTFYSSNGTSTGSSRRDFGCNADMKFRYAYFDPDDKKDMTRLSEYNILKDRVKDKRDKLYPVEFKNLVSGSIYTAIDDEKHCFYKLDEEHTYKIHKVDGGWDCWNGRIGIRYKKVAYAHEPQPVKQSVLEIHRENNYINAEDYEVGKIYKVVKADYYRYLSKDPEIIVSVHENEAFDVMETPLSDFKVNATGDIARIASSVPEHVMKEFHKQCITAKDFEIGKIYKGVVSKYCSYQYRMRIDDDLLFNVDERKFNFHKGKICEHTRQPIYMEIVDVPEDVMEVFKKNTPKEYSVDQFEDGKFYYHDGYYEGYYLVKDGDVIYEIDTDECEETNAEDIKSNLEHYQSNFATSERHNGLFKFKLEEEIEKRILVQFIACKKDQNQNQNQKKKIIDELYGQEEEEEEIEKLREENKKLIELVESFSLQRKELANLEYPKDFKIGVPYESKSNGRVGGSAWIRINEKTIVGLRTEERRSVGTTKLQERYRETNPSELSADKKEVFEKYFKNCKPVDFPVDSLMRGHKGTVIYKSDDEVFISLADGDRLMNCFNDKSDWSENYAGIDPVDLDTDEFVHYKRSRMPVTGDPSVFPVGTIMLGNKGSLYYKKSKDEVVSLNNHNPTPTKASGNFNETYSPLDVNDLKPNQLANYEKHLVT
jgi:hypothetical protein